MAIQICFQRLCYRKHLLHHPFQYQKYSQYENKDETPWKHFWGISRNGKVLEAFPSDCETGFGISH